MDYLFDPNLCSAVVYYLISYLYVRPHHGLRERTLLGALALLLGTLAACKSDRVSNLHPIHHLAPMEDRGPNGEIGLMAEAEEPRSVCMGSGSRPLADPGMTIGVM